MITNNVLNIDNKPYVNNAYYVEVGAHRSIDCVVFADNEQEALDIVIDHYEAKRSEYEGFFFSDEELLDGETELGDYISGGNCGTYITFTYDECRIKECSVDDIEIYIDLTPFN
tara:strand:- start:120 stop:461 length:342 start_codon:yes stop_codon:yes gene_type:complete